MTYNVFGGTLIPTLLVIIGIISTFWKTVFHHIILFLQNLKINHFSIIWQFSSTLISWVVKLGNRWPIWGYVTSL